jgi:2-dehydropantoate 2-reductase
MSDLLKRSLPLFPPIKKISFIGAGAMGASYMSLFYAKDKDCVSVVAKGDRYRRLSEHGLIINGKQYFPKLLRPDERDQLSDLIIIAVKHHDLSNAIDDIHNFVGEKTVILSIMNGIESEEQIASVYGKEKVLYAIVVGISAVKEKNCITFSPTGKLFFGEETNTHISEKVKAVQSLFDAFGILYEIPKDMIRTLWWKFMINTGINQVSAVLGANYGVFQKSKEAKELMEEAMQEVISIAKAREIHLYNKDIDEWYTFLSNQPPEGKTSMLQDFEAKRKTEVEMLAGKLIELGKKYNIPTPLNDTLFKIIKAIEYTWEV